MPTGIDKTAVIKAELDNGTTIFIQSVMPEGEEDVAFTTFSFKDITDAIEGIAESITSTLKKVKPHSASVEFGLEVSVDSGKLTALLVKGTGTANLKITLQWGEMDDSATP